MPLLPWGSAPASGIGGSGISQATADARYQRSAQANYFREDASATTTYEATNYTSASSADTGSTIRKTVLSGSLYQIRSVYLATDAWDNRLTATYTLQTPTYSN